LVSSNSSCPCSDVILTMISTIYFASNIQSLIKV
jgi:hypothetical protein